MVKYSNKGKGKPSKRRTYKVKFKIEKKVKQHKKRLKKEVKKMQGKGLKYKGIFVFYFRIIQNSILTQHFPLQTANAR